MTGRTRWPPRAAALLGLLWYLQIGGLATLSVTNLEWLLAGDWLQHALGWLMFRHEPWTLPLGTLSNSLYPVGSTIGFTDSNPLVSILLKPFSGLLPVDFQFIGPWLALCFMLQGSMGARLSSLITDDPWQQTFGGYLFVLTPVLLGRLAHDTLCAHWLVLAMLYLGLRTARWPDRQVRLARDVAISITLVAIASVVHPYLAAMCWTLAAAFYANLWRLNRLRAAHAALSLAAATGAMLAMLGLFGYLGPARVAGVGFGEYSADLLTFINSATFSRWLPALPMNSTQAEGLGFLGVGGIVAALCGGIVAFRRRALPGLRGAWPILLACTLMGVYALSAIVTIGGRTVVDLGWLYAVAMPLVAPFRSSGRFIWPLHYLVLLFGVWGVVRLAARAPASTATALLGLVVAVHAADIHLDDWWASPKNFRQVPFAELRPLAGKYRHIALVPMQVFGVCGGEWNGDYVYRFMLFAYRMRTTFNGGIFARLPPDEVRAACQALEDDLAAGRLNRETIYAVAADRVPQMRAAGAACGRFDGDWFCVSRDGDPTVVRYLEPPR